MVAAYICWLLVEGMVFHEAVRFDHLPAGFKISQGQLDVATVRLWRVVQLGSALGLAAAQGACGEDVVKTRVMISHVSRAS